MACAILKVQLTKGLDMELDVEKVNVDLERGTVIITGYDVLDIISQIGTVELLKEMEYADVMDYVTEVEQEKADLDAELKSTFGE